MGIAVIYFIPAVIAEIFSAQLVRSEYYQLYLVETCPYLSEYKCK